MAQIILNTGEILEVTYNQAAKVYQVLTGNKQPYDDAQAEFITTVADVKFPARKLSQAERSSDEPDSDLHNIMNGQYRDGYSKFKAIGSHLKQRRGI